MAKVKQAPTVVGKIIQFLLSIWDTTADTPQPQFQSTQPANGQTQTAAPPEIVQTLVALEAALERGGDAQAVQTAFAALSQAERQAHWHTGETVPYAQQMAAWEQSMDELLAQYTTDPALSDGLALLRRTLRQTPYQPVDTVEISAHALYRTFIEEGNGDVVRFAQQIATTNTREEISANQDLIVQLARMFGPQTATHFLPYIYHLKAEQVDQECATVLGIDQQTGNEIFLSEKTRSQLVTVCGAMGVGKSVFLEGLIDQDIHQGRSVIVIDPHGSLVRHVVARMPEERLDDVYLLDLASENAVGLNLFACPQPRTIHTIAATANSISHVFEKVFGTGVDRTPRLLGVLRAITRLLIDNDLTLAEIPLIFSSDALRAKMVANCSNSSIVSFWEGYNRRSQRDKDDLVASTSNKIMSFLDHDLLRLIVSQSKTTLDMRQILDEGKILLVSLSPQYQEASTLIGATLISQLLSAMYARGPYPENDHRACALYCDEYASYATEDFATLCTESRKFRILNSLAFQVLETLDDANRATALQAGTLVVFRVSGDDAKIYARSFDSTPAQEQTGWEPVRAVPTDCISHLLRRSHANPIVTKFVTDYLMPLDTLIKSHGHSNQAFGFGVSLFSATYAIHGQQVLNECLFECMQSGRADGFIPPLALFTLGGAAEPGITAVFYDDIKRDPFFTGHLFLGLYKSANRFGRASFLTNTKAVDELVKKHAKRKLYGRVTTPGPSFIAMLKSLRQTMEILGKEPVMVDSGQYRPIYRQRGFNDVEAEIANLIKTQDNYVARVKVLTSEHTIRTAPPPPLLPDEQINERINYIKNHMLNLGLCKPAHEVEDEIRLRQEKLLAPTENDSPPPTHTNRRRFRQKPSTDS